MYKFIQKFKFLMLAIFMFIFCVANGLTADFIGSKSHTKLQQGQEVTLTITTTGDFKIANTSYTGGPSFIIEGCSVSDITSLNNRMLQGKVVVARNADLGDKTLTMFYQNGIGEHTPLGTNISTTTTITIVSQPTVTNISPLVTYQQSSAMLTVSGDYFASGVSTMVILGSGVKSTATISSQSEALFDTIDLTAANPSPVGSPYFIQLICSDGGQGVSSQGLLTIHPKPTITSVTPSVYQGQQGATVVLKGTGISSSSQVLITTDSNKAYIDPNIAITGATPSDIGEIKLTLNVNKSVATGKKYFYIINPDGNGTDANISAVKEIENFVTPSYTPTIDKEDSTTTVQQGFQGLIYISSSGINAGFEVDATSITVQGYGITIGSIQSQEGSDITYSGNIQITNKLAVWVNVSETAQIGTRNVILKNPTYGTQGSYEITITTSPKSNLPNATITWSTDTLYAGVASTMTITITSGSEQFENGATVSITNIDSKNITTTFISTSTLWCYVNVPATAPLDQEQTITVRNPTYQVSKSKTITITKSEYQKMAFDLINSTDTGVTIYQGQTSTMTITLSEGKIETLADQKNSVTITGGVTINSVVKKSDQELWINYSVGQQATVGEQYLILSNTGYSHSISTSITIAKGDYSSPTITDIGSSITPTGTSITLYKGEKKEVWIVGTGFFHSNISFTSSNDKITITPIQIFSSTYALVSIAVPDTDEVNVGDYSLKITNTDFGSSYTKQNMIKIADKHKINSISPQMLAQGTSEYFYINGTDFDPTSAFTILIDGNPVTVNDYSDTSKIVFISSHCISKQQIATHVYVSTGVNSGVHDLGVYFAVNGATVTKVGILTVPTQPEITSIPSTLSQGDTNKEVTIQGKNFESGATVVVSGSGIIITSSTVISSNIMTFRCDVTGQAERTDRQLRIINPTGQFAIGTIRVISPPKVTSVNPSSVMRGTTRYIEIKGESFSEYCNIVFSGTTTYESNGDTALPESIHIISLDYAGENQLTSEVYIGTNAVSGTHDVKVINYEDSTKTVIQAQGIGAGVFSVRTPLNITNAEAEYKIPAGLKDKIITLRGEGFSEENMSIEFSGSGITITNTRFINSQEIELKIDVASDANLGNRTLTIKYNDDSAFKQIVKIIQPVTIKEVNPTDIAVGLKFATMTISAIGLDLNTTTLKTVIIDGNSIEGIDPTNQVEISGEGIEELIIDSTTYRSDFMKLYFTIRSTATLGSRDIVITNKDNENILEQKGAFNVVEKVKVNMFSPSQYQATDEEVSFRITGTNFDGKFHPAGGSKSSVTFNNEYINITEFIYSNDTEIQGKFKWTGSTETLVSSRYVDVSVQNEDGSTGKLTGGIYLLEELKILDTLTSPRYIPIGAQSFIVRVKGRGFVEGADVVIKIGADESKVQITNIRYVNSEELVVTLNADSGLVELSSGTLVVTNPGGMKAESENLFTFATLPKITSISPTYIRIGGHKEITITGSNFNLINSTSSVAFSHGLTFSTTSSDSTSMIGTIRATVASYTGDAIVYLSTYTAPSGSEQIKSVLEGFFQVKAEPSITEIVPTLVYQDKATQFYINGSNFDTGIGIVIREVSSGLTTYATWIPANVQQTQTRIVIPELQISQQGSYTIELTNTDGSKVIKREMLTVSPAILQASISGLSPNYATLGEKNKTLNVTGANFLEGMSIYFEGTGITITTYTRTYSTVDMSVDIAETVDPGEHNLVFLNQNSSTTTAKFYVMAKPVITKITPSSVQQGTTVSVRIEGENFIEDGGVEGGDISFSVSGTGVSVISSSTTFISGKQINGAIYVSEDTAVGNHDIIVTNPFATKGTGYGLLKIVAPVSVTTLSPSSVAQGDTNKEITVNGAGFEEGLSVEFTGTGITINKTSYVSDAQIVLNVTVADNATMSNRGIKIINLNANPVTVADKLTVGPKVLVERTSPSQIARGVSNKEVEIIGSNFGSSTNTVTISGSGITISSTITNSSTLIKVILTVDENATLGARTINVITENNSEGVGDQVLQLIDAVKIDSVDPSMITVSSYTETRVPNFWIYGSGFTVDTTSPTITFTGGDVTVISSMTSVLGSTGIETELVIATAETLGKRDIKVQNSDGSFGNATGIVEFVTPIAITTATPHYVGKGVSNKKVTVTGRGFSEKVKVESDDADITLTSEYISRNELKLLVTVPSSYDDSVATFTLRNPNNDTTKVYLSLQSVPIVNSISPSFVCQGASTGITMKGKGLANVSNVSRIVFSGNDITVSSITSSTDEELKVDIEVAKSATLGTKNLTIKDDNDKTATSESVFTIKSAPTITSLQPASVRPDTTHVITINGAEFVYGATMTIKNADDFVTIWDYSYLNANLINVRVYVSSTATPGDYDVEIKNPDNSMSTMFGMFKILELAREPVISSIVPSKMFFGSGSQTMIITGNYFESDLNLSFSGTAVSVSSVNVQDTNQIIATVAIGNKGTESDGYRDVTILNGTGKRATAVNLFTLVSPVAVTDMYPTSLTLGTTNFVKLNGSGFVQNDSSLVVTSDTGIAISSTTVIGTGQITFNVYIGTDTLIGKHDIKVTNENGYATGIGVFEVVPPLEITSVGPTEVASGSNSRDVYIYGTGFNSTTQVAFEGGGITVDKVYFQSERVLRAVITVEPTAVLGDRKVILNNDNGDRTDKTGVFSIVLPVTVTSTDPTQASVGILDKLITITGTQFASGAQVSFSGTGITVTTVTVVSAERITAYITIGENAEATSRNITVTNLNGNYGTKEAGFVVVQTVKVTSMMSNSDDDKGAGYFTLKPNLTYQDVLIRGEGFKISNNDVVPTIEFSLAGVTIDPNISIDYRSSSELSARINVDTTTIRGEDKLDVRVRNYDGTTGKGTSIYYFVDNLEPRRVIPADLGRGSENTTITILGQGFVDGIDVEFTDTNITVNSVKFLDLRSLEANITIKDVTTVGQATFTITNPSQKVGVSTYTLFTVTDAPVISSIYPEKFAQGALNQELNIYGSGFDILNTTVTISGGVTVSTPTVNASSTTITVYVSVNRTAGLGTRNILVAAGGQTGVTERVGTGKDLLEIVTLPKITTVLPSTIIQGSQRRTIEIRGQGFDGTSVVKICNTKEVDAPGITIESTSRVSAEKISLIVSASSTTSEVGYYDIKITNGDGSYGKGEGVFSVSEPPIPPVMQSIAPVRLRRGEVNQQIVIKGYNFQDKMSVAFSGGGITLSNYVYSNDLSQVMVTATIAQDASIGLRGITYTNPDGGVSTYPDEFEVFADPKITSLEPSNAVIKSSYTTTYQDITINGEAFKEETQISFSNSDITISSLTFMGATQLKGTLVVSSGVPAGYYDILITNPYGATGISEGYLRIADPIIISSMTPTQMSKGSSNQELKIYGSGFSANSTLSFSGSGITVNSAVVNNANLIIANISISEQATEGLKKVTVTNPDKLTSGDYGVDKFEVLGEPKITEISPANMQQNAEGWINIKGSGIYGSTTLLPSISFSGYGINVSTVLYNGSQDVRAYVKIESTATIGVRDITIITKDSSTTTIKGVGLFTVSEILTVTNLSVSKLPQGITNRSISVVGTGFIDGATASFSGSGVQVGKVNFRNSGELEIIVDVQDTANLTTRDITIINPNGYKYALKDILEIVSPIVITEADPKEVSLGYDGDVRLIGQHFENNSAVTIFGAGLNYSVKSYNATEIVINLQVGSDAPLTKRDMKVSAPSGNEGTASEILTITNGIIVSEISPKYLVRGTTGSTITLRGSGIEYSPQVSSVTLSGTGITITNANATSSTQLKFLADVAVDAVIGARDLFLENSDGIIGRVDGGIIVIDPLTITKVEPSSLGKGANNETVSIYGTGFTSESVPTFATSSGISIVSDTIEYVSSNQIRMKINVSSTTSVNTYAASVRNPSLNQTATNNTAISITNDPVITSISLSEVSQGAQNRTIIIYGKNFDVANATSTLVSISGSGISVSTFAVVSSEQIDIEIDITKTATLGTRDIVITNLDGSYGIARRILTITQGPSISLISPNFIDLGISSKTISIQGKGFVEGMEFSIPDSTGLSIYDLEFINSQLIKIKISADKNALLGTYDVLIKNPDESSETLSSAFSIVSPPIVTQVSVPMVKRGQTALTIDIFGSYFQDGASVYINGLTVTSTTYKSNSQLSIVVNVDNTATEGLKDVLLTNPSGSQGTGSNLIQVVGADPVIKSLRVDTTKIDYEQISSSVLRSSATISWELSQTVQSLEVQILRFVGSLTNSPEVVYTRTYQNQGVGTHSIVWDGTVSYVLSNTQDRENTTDWRKENAQYIYKLKATTEAGVAEVYGFEQIEVEVCHISDQYATYTLIGDEKAKVAPYTLNYHLSKDANVNIEVKNSSGTVVRTFANILATKGKNTLVWDGRNTSGIRVTKGIYYAVINAYDNSDPVDHALTKIIDIKVEPLQIVDFKIATISNMGDTTKITFVPSETMTIDATIYKHGTNLRDNGDGTITPNITAREVKNYKMFVEKGTSVQIEWDGRNERGDILVDGLYPIAITGYDSNGVYMQSPKVSDISINRMTTFEARVNVFEVNFYAYPNPVDVHKKNCVKIQYGIGVPTDLKLYVYDITGNKVWEKELGVQTSSGEIDWYLVNNLNNPVGRGIYILYLAGKEVNTAKRLKATNKVMVIK